MLEVGGLVPLSTSDFPDRLSAVVFLQGCPWKCAYCHNPELQPRAAAAAISWEAVMAFLGRRVGLLDAVVLSGGEPTLQAALARGAEDIRRRGFAVGLHTAGIYPRRLAEALPSLEWVGLDIKAGFEGYARVIGRKTGASAARESLDLLLASGVSHEVRTTWHPALASLAELVALAEDLARKGVRRFALQLFNPEGCRDVRLLSQHRPQLDDDVLARLRPMFETFILRPQPGEACA